MGKFSIKYTYGRFGVGPGVGGNAVCSNHHVLPYYVMEYIGLLWCALAGDQGQKDQAKYAKALAALVPTPVMTNMIAAMPATTGEYLVAEGNAAFANFMGTFAWLGDNLFTGPAATYRVVDPSQRLEPEKPTSFPDKRWKAIDAVWQQVRGIGVLPHETGARMKIEVPDFTATKIIEAAMACFHGATPHRTVVSDWCAVTMKDQKTRYLVDVNVLADSSKVDDARKLDRSFDWCELDLVASGERVAQKAYRRIIQVTGGAQGKIASIEKTDSPTKAMGDADFVTAFHVL